MKLCFRQKLRTFNIEIQLEGGRDDRYPWARIQFDKKPSLIKTDKAGE